VFLTNLCHFHLCLVFCLIWKLDFVFMNCVCCSYYQQTVQSNAFLLRVLLEHSCLVWIASGIPAASPITFYGLKHYHVTSVSFKMYIHISFHKEYGIWNFRLAPSNRVHNPSMNLSRCMCPSYAVCWSETAVFCERQHGSSLLNNCGRNILGIFHACIANFL
jgi:hypothetical protein